MIVSCPNCEYEFIVDKNAVTGECPRCKIKLAFRTGNEKIEVVNIKKIEGEIDKFPSVSKKIDVEIVEEKATDIDKKVDEIIG